VAAGDRSGLELSGLDGRGKAARERRVKEWTGKE